MCFITEKSEETALQNYGSIIQNGNTKYYKLKV